MELNLLNTYGVSCCGGEVFPCGCGKTHRLKTKAVFFESGAMDKLASAAELCAPPLSLVYVITEKAIADKIKPRIDKLLSRGGFRAAVHAFESRPFAEVKFSDVIKVPENARLIVGVGGGTIADIAKYKAQQLKLPCVVCVTSPASYGVMFPSAVLTDRRIEQTFKTEPPAAVVCDTDIIGSAPRSLAASGFGGLVSKLVALFDWKAAALINAEYFCADLFDAALSVIDSCLDKICAAHFPQKNAAASIAEDNLRFSAVCQLTGSSRLSGGAESQCAHALKLLFDTLELYCFTRG